MAKSVLVTGGAGFIGSALAHVLIRQGRQVVIADNLSTGFVHNVPSGCRFVKMDVGNPEHYARLDGIEFEAVMHLAAQSSGEASFIDPWYDFNSHATATFLLLDLCRRRSIKRFLYASSMSVYGNPQYLPVDEAHPTNPKTFYASGKLAAEAYVRLHSTLGMDTTIFRMFSVYGPNQNLANQMQGMVSIFFSYIVDNQPILVKGSRHRFRDFVYIDDVVDAWLAALDNPKSFGKTYNLSTGNKTTVEELLTCLAVSSGNSEYPITFANETPGDQFGLVGNTESLKRDLDWAPKWDLKTGVQDLFKTYHKHKAGV